MIDRRIDDDDVSLDLTWSEETVRNLYVDRKLVQDCGESRQSDGVWIGVTRDNPWGPSIPSQLRRGQNRGAPGAASRVEDHRLGYRWILRAPCLHQWRNEIVKCPGGIEWVGLVEPFTHNLHDLSKSNVTKRIQCIDHPFRKGAKHRQLIFGKGYAQANGRMARDRANEIEGDCFKSECFVQRVKSIEVALPYTSDALRSSFVIQ